MPRTPIKPLVDLGFTALEAEVYTWLLDEAPATGYRVAQALRKPAPNIYKAVESLEGKGAVIVDEGARRLCRAVPPEEVLGHLERRFRERKELAARALSELSPPKGDDRVYRLRSAEAVLERARTMLARAEEIVLVDAFPRVLEALRAELEKTGARGVDLAILTYAPAEVKHARVITAREGRETLGRWPGQWLSLTVDGREHLIAFLTPDIRSVRQAIWTSSLYLAWVYHGGLSAELILAAVERAVDEDGSPEDIRRTLTDNLSLRAKHARGYRDLRRRIDESNGRGAVPDP